MRIQGYQSSTNSMFKQLRLTVTTNYSIVTHSKTTAKNVKKNWRKKQKNLGKTAQFFGVLRKLHRLLHPLSWLLVRLAFTNFV